MITLQTVETEHPVRPDMLGPERRRNQPVIAALAKGQAGHKDGLHDGAAGERHDGYLVLDIQCQRASNLLRHYRSLRCRIDDEGIGPALVNANGDGHPLKPVPIYRDPLGVGLDELVRQAIGNMGFGFRFDRAGCGQGHREQ